jgi:hypothetical protein
MDAELQISRRAVLLSNEARKTIEEFIDMLKKE